MAVCVYDEQKKWWRPKVRPTRWTIEAGRTALLGMVLAAAAGCAPQPKSDPETQDVSTVHYLCEDGTRLGVWFEPEAAIVTENGGETMILPQKRAGSGIWYGLDKADFRGKGDAATWTSGGRPSTQCHVTDRAPET